LKSLIKYCRKGGLAVLLGILLCSTASNQSSNQSAIIPFSGKFFTTDNLGNIFLIQSDNSIEKYDPNGKRLAVVNFKIYGNLSQLDVTNPFEIYGYYADQQILLILDNMLNLRSEIDMTEISTGEVSAAARAFDNGIWYFDASSMKLLKATKNLKTQIEGAPMATWTSETWRPSQILDNEKNIFVHDSSNGICLFDVFGNYYKSIDVTGLLDFQVKKNKLLYFQNTHFVSYDYKLFRYDTMYSNENAKSVRMENDRIFSWRGDSLEIIVKK
jgi:hypothetical protein